LTLTCCNKGGPGSCLKLPIVPAIEESLPLDACAVATLDAWQARPGEILSFIDPELGAWRCRLEKAGDAWHAVPFEGLERNPESVIEVDLLQALPQRERFELILEKATELGVSRIIPYQSERSISLAERDARQKKSHRWPDVILRAARQCRRTQLPELYPTCTWDEALYVGNRADLRLVLYEGASAWQLGEVLQNEKPRRVSVMVGPEGGFTPAEIAEARDLGFLTVGLGPRLLRTETAAIAAVAVVQTYLGDF